MNRQTARTTLDASLRSDAFDDARAAQLRGRLKRRLLVASVAGVVIGVVMGIVVGSVAFRVGGLGFVMVLVGCAIFASAVGCLLIGGFLAGRLSGVPGAGTGLAHGLTLWALTLLVVLAIGIPSVINVLNLGRVATELQPTTSVIASGVDSSLWATFIAMVGALVAAGIGGMIGGASQRRHDHVEDLDRR